MPADVEGRPRLILDAMVLAAGLTSRREPASYSRRLIELAFDDAYDLVVTETLIDETYEVLIDANFIGYVSEEEAGVLITGLAIVAKIVIRDRGLTFPQLTDDESDDYLADAALRSRSFLVTRDDRAAFGEVPGLESGRPGNALRRLGTFRDDEPPPESYPGVDAALEGSPREA